MNPITQLNQSLINKIAAGEVVERPLSVVKELTENAIDAGASMVTVEIKDGGLSSVRVTDNGGGIPEADLPLAFARHATSKITDFDDLMSVQTLGFRGEALSSIAAVAQVEMITKTQGQIAGTRVEVHGGQMISSGAIGCADGTTVVVSNLFYNTPARRKFLKKPATEAASISFCLERLALGNPSLVLRYINNGQIVFQTTGNNDLKTTMLNIYGREVAAKTVSVNAVSNDMRLLGLIGKPETARGNRKHGSFFINGRYIESKLITRAVEAAMKTMLPSGKFPVYSLNLSMPHDTLDVNVHPTKMDVRFADEEGVFAFIEDAVRDALEEHNLIPTTRHGRVKRGEQDAEAEQIPLHEPFAIPAPRMMTGLTTRNPIGFATHGGLKVKHAITMDGTDTELPPWSSLREERAEAEPEQKKFFTQYEIQGLVFQTYWLVSQGESLYMIDRHAAHERVLYENFLRKAQEETVHSQALLTPIALRLTPREKQILKDNKELFGRFGFDISDDEEKPEILSVPFLMKGPLNASFFTELLDKMDEAGFAKDSPYTHKTELIAMAACKAAIKAGDTQTDDEAHDLITQLLELNNPFTCPHGRPTIIEITKTELERRFKR
ncbi:MAG: DNA mismatch repair endonuclease MutL [Defluviitaleaceae bacterium]|nr:DNA mismatch repair endonuclease MutL [Defluviitaleaceae bacterium]MCL2262329.1 DNA mismatch repair endonuclease MutL [Defluviitaleaceae bacterium]